MLNRFVDNTGRRPSGRLGKMMYRNPLGHYQSCYTKLYKNSILEDMLKEVRFSIVEVKTEKLIQVSYAEK